MENWQSEYLQFTLYIFATVWLLQKGSNESKQLDRAGRETDEQQLLGEHAKRDSPSWARTGGLRTAIYSNSLVLVMGSIWFASWLAQSITGRVNYNADQMDHQAATVSWATYITTSDFWNRTLQNWQSEFLAVGSMAILSVYLRQRGSPESKPVGAPHSATASRGLAADRDHRYRPRTGSSSPCARARSTRRRAAPRAGSSATPKRSYRSCRVARTVPMLRNRRPASPVGGRLWRRARVVGRPGERDQHAVLAVRQRRPRDGRQPEHGHAALRAVRRMRVGIVGRARGHAEHQQGPAQRQPVAFAQVRAAADPLAVDIGAVARGAVVDHGPVGRRIVADELEPRVHPRDAPVPGQADVGRRRAADRDGARPQGVEHRLPVRIAVDHAGLGR